MRVCGPGRVLFRPGWRIRQEDVARLDLRCDRAEALELARLGPYRQQTRNLVAEDVDDGGTVGRFLDEHEMPAVAREGRVHARGQLADSGDGVEEGEPSAGLAQ